MTEPLVDARELVRGLHILVMNRSTLIDLKRRLGSHLDLADIDAIERLSEL